MAAFCIKTEKNNFEPCVELPDHWLEFARSKISEHLPQLNQLDEYRDTCIFFPDTQIWHQAFSLMLRNLYGEIENELMTTTRLPQDPEILSQITRQIIQTHFKKEPLVLTLIEVIALFELAIENQQTIFFVGD